MDDEILKNEKRWLLEEKYGGSESPEYFSDVEKLKNGYPVAYLIGNVEFLGCHIDLKQKPLIPRPETEFWVHDIIEEYKGRDVEVLDIFSGSGCIGISILKNIEHPHVDFGELKRTYITQIEKNIELNHLTKSNYNIYQSDVFENVPKENKYDLIISNPPYIDENRKDTVQDSVLENEDHDALFAKDNGMFFIKKIISEGFPKLKDHGRIYIEYDPWQTEMIQEYLTGQGYVNYKFKQDQYGKNRVLILEK